MKKLLLLLVAAGALCTACERYVETNEITLSLSGETLSGGTRVGIGDKVNGYYQLYWSLSDKVMCNGEISNSIIISENRSNLAKFFFAETITGPFDVVCPAIEGVASKTPGCYPVRFLAEQHYTEGTFDSAAVPMCRHSSNSSIILKQLTGTMRLPVLGDVTIQDIEITATDKLIAGIFDVNCKTGELTLNDEGSYKVNILFDEPLQLNTTTATPIYFTLPAGVLGRLSVKMTAANGQIMRFGITCDSEKPVRAGIVREIKEFAFENNATE